MVVPPFLRTTKPPRSNFPPNMGCAAPLGRDELERKLRAMDIADGQLSRVLTALQRCFDMETPAEGYSFRVRPAAAGRVALLVLRGGRFALDRRLRKLHHWRWDRGWSRGRHPSFNVATGPDYDVNPLDAQGTLVAQRADEI